MTDRPSTKVWTPEESARELRERTSARGVLGLLACVATGFLLFWFLGVATAWMTPQAPAGSWVIGPPRSLRLAASWYGPPFILMPFWSLAMRRWRRQDAADGLLPDAKNQTHLRKTLTVLVLAFFAALVAFAIYASLRSFDVVGPGGITVSRLPSARHYPYARIRSVEMSPDHPKAWGREAACVVTFDDRSCCTFGVDNGLREDEMVRIASHIAANAGVHLTTRRGQLP